MYCIEIAGSFFFFYWRLWQPWESVCRTYCCLKLYKGHRNEYKVTTASVSTGETYFLFFFKEYKPFCSHRNPKKGPVQRGKKTNTSSVSLRYFEGANSLQAFFGPESLFNAAHANTGLILRVSNMIVLSCCPASVMQRQKKNKKKRCSHGTRGCNSERGFWRPATKKMLEFPEKKEFRRVWGRWRKQRGYSCLPFKIGWTWWLCGGLMKRNGGHTPDLNLSARVDETCVLQRTDEMAWTTWLKRWRDWRRGEREAEAGSDVRVCWPARTGNECGSGKSKWAFCDYIFAKWD